VDMNCQQICKISHKTTTEVKIFQNTFRGYFWNTLYIKWIGAKSDDYVGPLLQRLCFSYCMIQPISEMLEKLLLTGHKMLRYKSIFWMIYAIFDTAHLYSTVLHLIG